MYQLDSIDVPPRESCWNSVKAAYRLVELDEGIDDSVKKEIMMAALGRCIMVE